MLQKVLFIIFVFIVNLTTNNQAVFTARRMFALQALY